VRILVHVAEPVTEHCAPVAIRRVEGFLHALRARLDGSTMRRVGVIDVHVEEHRKVERSDAEAVRTVAVTDARVGRPSRLDVAGGVEHGPKKRDRLDHVAQEDPWRDRAVRGRGRAAR
jgi:hypothetical protein